MMSIRKILHQIHLWLGLASGLVVFIVSLTGCLFCFHDEIKDLTRPWRKVEVSDQPYLFPSVFRDKAVAQVPGGEAGVVVYAGKDRSVAVFTKTKKDFFYVYYNPYTGRYLGIENLKKDFFVIVEYLHLYLLLPAPVGSQIVGISSIIFIILMITGLVLWWPRRKTDRKRSFTIKWGAKWKRVNYDLHNVLGFYATSITIILALTGLAIDYEWMGNAFYKTANLGKDYKAMEEVPKVDTLSKRVPGPVNAMDAAFQQILLKSPFSEMYILYAPLAGASLEARAYPHSLRYDDPDSYYFDPVTGKSLKDLPGTKKSAGLKLNEMNYGIHTGQVLGLAGKLIAFTASLIAASLPLTGFIIWLGRKKKSRSSPVQLLKRKSHRKAQLQP